MFHLQLLKKLLFGRPLTKPSIGDDSIIGAEKDDIKGDARSEPGLHCTPSLHGSWLLEPPRKFQVSNIKLYDGRTDFEEFLTLNSQMMLFEASDGFKCKTFSRLLDKSALGLFLSLQRGCPRIM